MPIQPYIYQYFSAPVVSTSEPLPTTRRFVTFNGTNNYITRGTTLPTFAPTGTIEMMVRVDATGRLHALIAGDGDAANGRLQSYINASNKPYFWQYTTSGSSVKLESSAALVTGQWHQLAFVFATGRREIWLDGVKVASDTQTARPETIWAFGRIYDGFATYFAKVSLDYLKFYPTALTGAELQAVAGYETAAPELTLNFSDSLVDSSPKAHSTFLWKGDAIAYGQEGQAPVVPFEPQPITYSPSDYYASFDGTGRIVLGQQTFDFAKGLTLSWRMNRDATSPSYSRVFEASNGGQTDQIDFEIFQTTMYAVFVDSAGVRKVCASSGSYITLNEWHDYAVVVDNADKTCRFYRDGALINTVTAVNPPNSNTRSLCVIGAAAAATLTSASKMGLDNLQLWKSPRAAADVHQQPTATHEDLVAYYRMDNTANDLSGNNKNGTVEGGVTFINKNPAPVRHYASLNGSKSLEFSSGGIALSTTYAVETMVRLDSSGSEWGLWDMSQQTTYYYTCRLDAEGRPQLFRGTTSLQMTSSVALTPGKWHHLAVSFTTAGRTMYLDGQVVATSSGASVETVRFFSIGTVYSQSKYIYTACSFDDFRVWNTGLGQSDVQALAGSSDTPTSPDLYAHLKLDGNLSDAGRFAFTVTAPYGNPTYQQN